MPRTRNKKYPNHVDYTCDNCKRKCGGGFITIRNRLPAIVLCSSKCKEEYKNKKNT